MARRLPLLVLLALVAAGCGVRSSKPFTAAASVGCFRSHGFKDATTNPDKVGFIAGFSDRGGLKGTAPDGNVLTIAFTQDATTTGQTETAFRNHAPPRLRPHMHDIMSVDRNAVIVWTISPSSDDTAAVNLCLRG